MTSEQETIFSRLRSELLAAQAKFDLADSYYDGMQRLEQLGLAIPPELQRLTVIVNWPRVVVDATADRLDVKGFRLPGADAGDMDLWRIWQANGMDDQDQLAKLDYLIFGRTYRCVGASEDDPSTPIVTVESPRSVITARSERTGKVTAALRMYDVINGRSTAATLYLPNETVWLD